MLFLIDDLIFIEKVSEYEILFIYVKKTYRRKGLVIYLLNNIYIQKKQVKLEKNISRSCRKLYYGNKRCIKKTILSY